MNTCLFAINTPYLPLFNQSYPNIRNDNMSNTCSLCNSTYVWPADLKRHLKSKYGQQKSTPKQQQQPCTFTSEQQQQQLSTFTPEQQQQQYSQSNEEEPYYMTQTNNPYIFYVPDKYDPGHFMPWVHPFISVIAGPTGSGKFVFVRRSDIWWPQYRIASCGVMENTRLYTEP